MNEAGHPLGRAVVDAARAHLSHLLSPDRVRATYVRNAGGFVNASFLVSDGRTHLHLKVARDADAVAHLRQWRSLAPRLEARYLAPEVLGVVPIGEGMEGTVFEHVAGAVAPPESSTWIGPVAAAISRLHGDAALARLLPHTAVSCRDAWRDTFQDRFDADLEGVRRARPPFISDDVMEVLASLVEGMSREVSSTMAFDEPANACVHGDLWRNNILVGPGSRVTILDWDDLAVGDPALDWAVLLGFDPARGEAAADDPPAVTALPPAARVRFDVYRRATVLDHAIDSLADWVEAVDAPHVRDSARAFAERTHRAAWKELARLGLVPGSLAAMRRSRHIPPPSSTGRRES